MSGFSSGDPVGRYDALTGSQQVTFSEGNHDAFERLRVSNSHILLSSQQIFDTQALIWDTELSGTSSILHSALEATTHLIVHGDIGDKVIRQTKRYWMYRAGQSLQIAMSFADAYQAPGIRKRVGYFDDYNGIFLESSDEGVFMVKRSQVSGTVVDTKVPQASWNMDALLGEGSSGLTLDLTKAQILMIDLQWLGAGRVRTAFNIDGRIIFAHGFNHANNVPTVYISRANLPARYEIESTGSSGGGVLAHICASVVREGGAEEPGILVCTHTSISGTTATTTPSSALAIRLKASHIRAYLQPTHLSIANKGTQLLQWHMVLNPTLTGALAWTDGYGESSEQSLTQLPFTAGSGHYLTSGYVSGGTTSEVDIVFDTTPLGVAADIKGVSDILAIIVRSDLASQNIAMAMTVLELF